MEDKHTSGPWKVERGMDQMIFDDTTVCIIDYGDGEKFFVSSPSYTHGDPEAVAKLIAAAPDLLAAARLVVSNLLSTEPGYNELMEAIYKTTL